jgi:hypothetical protein
MALAPHLDVQLLREALEVARGIGSDEQRAAALTILAPHLGSPLLRQALQISRAIYTNEQRAASLTALAPHLERPEQQLALNEAVKCLSLSLTVGASHLWPEMLAVMAPHLAKVPCLSLIDAWRSIIHLSSSMGRPVLLESLIALKPVLVAQGGSLCIKETTQAIIDAGNWWP